MNFYKNELMNEVLDNNFDTWRHTLDTKKFTPQKLLNKIDMIVFKNMQKQLKEADIFNLLYLQDQGIKLSFFQKLKINLSGLRPLYEAEKLYVGPKELKAEIKEVKVESTDKEQAYSLVNTSEASNQIQTSQRLDS